jgi:alkylation response protein AidB-like acyl-CoA dehydrogenase
MLSYPDATELDELRDAVRRFAIAEIAPLARRIDREDWFARELWPKMGELGILLGPTVPEECGGNLCVNQIQLHGTDEQKRRFLPALISGEAVGALAMSEEGVALFAAEAATHSALDAIQCLGGNGYTNDYDAGRLLRGAKLYEIGGGTSEIRRMLIGRELLR